jgi:Zn-dependent protease
LPCGMYRTSRSRLNLSTEEVKHLLMAWFAISLAFTIISVPSGQFLGLVVSLPIALIISFFVSAFTVGIGFLLHELAHKVVAQRYGCWAEFRADTTMLMFAVVSAFFGFIFAAPGAVYIHGNVNTEKNGKISIAGPAMNLVLAVVFVLLSLIPTYAIVGYIAAQGYVINTWLALFNMIPLGNFDGVKILRWNKPVYFGFLVLALAMNFVIYI